MEGLQIYALCLWQLGKNDMALSAARTLAANTLSMDTRKAAASISFISRLMYYISGEELISILKMPKELFQSSKVSFIVSAIDALDRSIQLEPIVSYSRHFLVSSEDIASMHSLIALGKLVSSVQTFQLILLHLNEGFFCVHEMSCIKYAMHLLWGLQVKHVSNDCLGIQNAIDHLRKALHMYPNSSSIR